MKLNAVIGLMALTLFSCGKFPVANDLSLSFSTPVESFSTALNTNADGRFNVLVRTDALPAGVVAQAVSAKLFVGAQAFQGSSYPVEPDNTFYQFNVGNRCGPSLKGKDVTFKYEVYDQKGTVLRQKSVTVPSIDGC
ncbi:hypothetical protein [Deinococcus sp. AJ005]|uniref:hypothetical protein n=1 Tax=Deinococcus sp. AJ005 TaxID=2652443 RepID=UPI00125CBFC3|nr:hypothetical protein [Deinococcus sp. AJ005]QFP78516.1 hypothetical protein DAAJ005_18250 [Deinococcus sp. AJ005]